MVDFTAMARSNAYFAAVFFCLVHLADNELKDAYLKKRKLIVEKEAKLFTGGNLTLTSAEVKVNTMLMDLKAMEIYHAREKGGVYPPSLHFFKAKKYIDQSKVFQVIKAMPKGAVLHLHDGAMVDVHWVIQKATYQSTCYTCFDQTGQQYFTFSKSTPGEGRAPCKSWTSVPDLRKRAASPEQFDEELYRNLTLMVEDPDKAYPSQTVVWNRFTSLFISLFSLLDHAPMWKDYLYQGLLEFYEDNVQYLEIRSVFRQLYELDGSVHSLDYAVETYVNVTKAFIADHPDFAGVKIINSAMRHSNKSDIAEGIKTTLHQMEKYPDCVAGFDLVAREDSGYTLLFFLEELLSPSQQGAKLPYFFHAGETDWQGEQVDGNLVDALLLNATRIGHGYALTKHPLLQQLYRERDIPVELNPISNQVLKLVHDMRDHPGSVLMARGFPVVIAPDDPALWGAKGVSYDFYEAFMGLGGNSANLATLKQLAMDSIRYSVMSPVEKRNAMKIWQAKWDEFIADAITNYQLL